MAYNDKDGKVVFSGKIDAIKALRSLVGKINFTINPNPLPDAPHKWAIEAYIGLKDAKDIVESIMALGVSELQKDERFNRPSPQQSIAVPVYVTNGDKQGYVTHYTLAGAIEAARNDRSVDKINFIDCDGHEETFFRNARTQTFELDII